MLKLRFNCDGHISVSFVFPQFTSFRPVLLITVISFWQFLDSNPNSVDRHPSVKRFDSFRAPESIDEDVQKEKERLMNTDESSLEGSSFSVVIKVRAVQSSSLKETLYEWGNKYKDKPRHLKPRPRSLFAFKMASHHFECEIERTQGTHLSLRLLVSL